MTLEAQIRILEKKMAKLSSEYDKKRKMPVRRKRLFKQAHKVQVRLDQLKSEQKRREKA